jgi:predicted metal-dependent hydrolase
MGRAVSDLRIQKKCSIQIRDLNVELVWKMVKHFSLRVLPPDGRITVTAPPRVSQQRVVEEVLARYDWILSARERVRMRARHQRLEFVSGEGHWFLGERYDLLVVEQEGVRPASGRVVVKDSSTLELRVARGMTREERAAVLDAWYREQLNRILPPLIAKGAARLGVQVREWRVRRMKTRWGTCNHRVGRIWLSLELAKRSLACIEYVVIHELAHLIEPNHGPRFKQILTDVLSEWRAIERELKQGTGGGTEPVRFG